MVFYAYFDPLLIPAAAKEGALGLACLLGVIRGLEANCFLAEFDDWHVQGEIKDHVDALEESVQSADPQTSAELSNCLKCLKTLLAALAKRNRFIYCLNSNGEPPLERVAVALVQGKGAELDIVLAEQVDGHPNPDHLPTATLRSYGATDFEEKRSHFAVKGMLATPGALGEIDFLNKSLRKVLKHAATIHIYDEVMGKRWGDNFEHTLKTLLKWLETFVANPDQCCLHLYCGKPSGFGDQHIKGQLASFRKGRLAQLPITIHFHETLAGIDTMPHDRFLLTDQMAVEIGRGMDFLDRTTRANRDASVNLKDLGELSRFLTAVATSSLPPVHC